MRPLRIPAAALLCVLSSACVHVRPEITRRYKTQVQVGDEHIAARLDVFAMDVPQESARTTLLNLAERGQASLIEQIGAKTKDASGLLAALGKPIKAPGNAAREVDHTVVQRRVILSVENTSPGPADRISLARVILDGLSAGARFKEWTQFATKYETADLGTLKFNRSREFDLDLKFDPTHHIKELTSAEATSKSTDAIEENIKLSQRYVPVTGSLSPTKAELIEQGVPGIDLTGNLAVDLSIEAAPGGGDTTDTFSFDSLFDETGAAKPPAQVNITRQTSRYVRGPVQDITANATLRATIRVVTIGDDTLMEGDDEVAFHTGSTQPLAVILVPKQALQFSVWTLRDEQGNTLAVDMGGGSDEAVQLAGFDDAVALRDYLKGLSDPGRIGNRPLKLNSAALTQRTAAGLQVHINKRNW